MHSFTIKDGWPSSKKRIFTTYGFIFGLFALALTADDRAPRSGVRQAGVRQPVIWQQSYVLSPGTQYSTGVVNLPYTIKINKIDVHTSTGCRIGIMKNGFTYTPYPGGAASYGTYVGPGATWYLPHGMLANFQLVFAFLGTQPQVCAIRVSESTSVGPITPPPPPPPVGFDYAVAKKKVEGLNTYLVLFDGSINQSDVPKSYIELRKSLFELEDASYALLDQITAKEPLAKLKEQLKVVELKYKKLSYEHTSLQSQEPSKTVKAAWQEVVVFYQALLQVFGPALSG